MESSGVSIQGILTQLNILFSPIDPGNYCQLSCQTGKGDQTGKESATEELKMLKGCRMNAMIDNIEFVALSWQDVFAKCIAFRGMFNLLIFFIFLR